MLTTPLVGDEVKAVLVVTALVLLGVTGFIVHTRGEWRRLRHRLFKRLEVAEGVSHPSRVAARLFSPRWDAAFHETLERALRDFEAEGNTAAAAILRAASDRNEPFREMAREIAIRAMTDGDLRSALVRLEQGIVYLLVFPGRHEDRRTLRRYPSLEKGWPAHAASVRLRRCRQRTDGRFALFPGPGRPRRHTAGRIRGGRPAPVRRRDGRAGETAPQVQV